MVDTSKNEPRDPFEVLVFEVGGRYCGLDASRVVELVRAAGVEPLPKPLETVDGLLNVRGEVAPVFDLRSRFGWPPRPPEHTDHFVVARAGERLVVIRADRAIEILRLEPEDVQAAEDVVPGAELVSEVVTLPEGLLFIYDLESFLSSAESAVVDDAVREAQHENGGEGAASRQV